MLERGYPLLGTRSIKSYAIMFRFGVDVLSV